MPCDAVRGDLALEGVVFSYPSRPGVQALQGLTLRIPAGSTCALVGASGGGKSTVVALLQRFYAPATGRVLLDGVDVERYDHASYHACVSLVSQEPVILRR